MDYDVLACRLMKEFGWTIEYTLNLTYPVFVNLFGLVKRVRADSAIDEFYYPYLAAKWGEGCREALFSLRGDIFLPDGDAPRNGPEKWSPEDLKRAERKLDRILAKRRKEMEAAAQGAV